MAEAAFIEKIEKIKMIYRILILAGTVALMGVAFVFLVYTPKTKQIEQLQSEINGLDQRITQAKIRARNLPKFEKEFEDVEHQFQLALRLLPNKREIPALLRGITQLGADANLQFRLFSPGRERPRDFYIEIPVAIQVSGKYYDVASFFDKVGKMERIVNILNVSMKPEKGHSTTLNTSCEAVTYRFKGSTDGAAAKKR